MSCVVHTRAYLESVRVKGRNGEKLYYSMMCSGRTSHTPSFRYVYTDTAAEENKIISLSTDGRQELLTPTIPLIKTKVALKYSSQNNKTQ